MNWRFCHLSIIALLLCLYPLGNTGLSSKPVQSPAVILFADHQKYVIQNFSHPSLAKVANALCLGNKTGVKKAHKKVLANLGLLHLLTPSGMHLSALLFFLSPILMRLKRFNKWIYWITELFFVIGLYSLTSFYSAKRVALLRHFASFAFKKNLSIYPFFIATLVIDFMLGSFHASPLSFIYSATFLGAIISCQQLKATTVMGMLFLCQFMLAAASQTFFYPLGAIFGLALCLFFPLSFPLLFICYWLPFTYPWLEKFLHLLFMLLHQLSTVAKTSGGLTPPHWIIIIIPLFLLNYWKTLRITAAVMLILFYPSNLYNLPLNRILTPSGGKISTINIKEVKQTRGGYQWRDRYLRKCQVSLFSDGYRERCD